MESDFLPMDAFPPWHLALQSSLQYSLPTDHVNANLPGLESQVGNVDNDYVSNIGQTFTSL